MRPGGKTRKPTVERTPHPKMLRTSLPSFLAPMLPTLIKEPFDSPDWIFEPKLDGYRAIAGIDSAGKARTWSRNGLPFEPKFPTVLDLLPEIKGTCGRAVFCNVCQRRQ